MERNLIFLNVKMTSNKKKNIPSEIVQIGAVKVAKVGNDFKLVSKFIQNVKPQNESLYDLAVARVSISKEELINAKSFLEVYEEFSNWANSIEENAFITWGKNDFKMIQRELSLKGYLGNYRITKYFNYQAYLETKMGRELGLLDALDTFNIKLIGDLNNALDSAKNMAVLYQKAIFVTDVNQLWFEGKLLRVKDELQGLIQYMKENNQKFVYDDEKAVSIISKCNLLLQYSESFSKEDRELKLVSLKESLDELSSEIEEIVLDAFNRDSMMIQWSIAKKQLHPSFSNLEEFKSQWINIQNDYKFFNKNRRGTYSLDYPKFKDVFRSIGRMKASFYESRKT